jgi:hypothetical protein
MSPPSAAKSISHRAIVGYVGLGCIIVAITAGEVNIFGFGIKPLGALEIKRQFLCAGLGVALLFSAAAWETLRSHWRLFLLATVILAVAWSLTCQSIDGTWYVHKIKDLSGNTTINTEKGATQFLFDQKGFIVTGFSLTNTGYGVLLLVLGNKAFGWVHRRTRVWRRHPLPHLWNWERRIPREEGSRVLWGRPNATATGV